MNRGKIPGAVVTGKLLDLVERMGRQTTGKKIGH
jgi:hypothetical protein